MLGTSTSTGGTTASNTFFGSSQSFAMSCNAKGMTPRMSSGVGRPKSSTVTRESSGVESPAKELAVAMNTRRDRSHSV